MTENPFQFSEESTVEENIELFFQYLSDVDPELAPVLREALSHVLPLSDNQNQRTTSRKEANEMVKSALAGLLESGDD